MGPGPFSERGRVPVVTRQTRQQTRKGLREGGFRTTDEWGDPTDTLSSSLPLAVEKTSFTRVVENQFRDNDIR